MPYNHLEGGDYMSTDINNNGENTFETNSKVGVSDSEQFSKKGDNKGGGSKITPPVKKT